MVLSDTTLFRCCTYITVRPNSFFRLWCIGDLFYNWLRLTRDSLFWCYLTQNFLFIYKYDKIHILQNFRQYPHTYIKMLLAM